jgi:hypothetical protein
LISRAKAARVSTSSLVATELQLERALINL